MARKSETVTNSSSNTQSTSQSQAQSQSTTQKVVNNDLLAQILAGLQGAGYTEKTEDELRQIAENRYNPVYNAETEAAKQKQQAADMGLAQQIENLIAQSGRQIDQQNAAYDKSRAGIETGALARGMGRSSYTMSTLNSNDQARASAIDQIMQEVGRSQGQLEAQRTQASEQLAQTLGRLSTDKEKNILNVLQELADSEYQRRQAATNQQNSNWLTALEMSMGQKTTGQESSQTKGTQTTNSTQTSTTTSGGGGSSGGSGSGGGANGQNDWNDLLNTILGDQKEQKKISGRYGTQESLNSYWPEQKDIGKK